MLVLCLVFAGAGEQSQSWHKQVNFPFKLMGVVPIHAKNELFKNALVGEVLTDCLSNFE